MHFEQIRRRLVPVVWFAPGLIGAASLAMPIPALPHDDLGLRRFRSPEVARGMRLAQTFRMTSDGFHAIEFRASAAGSRVAGVVRLEIIDMTGGYDRLLRDAAVNTIDLVRADSYRFEFPPLPNSRDRSYRFELTSTATRAGEGIVVWATKGERYRDGTMLANGKRIWADLAFQTHAHTLSGWRTLWRSQPPESNRPPGWLVFAAMAAGWAAIGVVLGSVRDVWERAST